MVVPSFKRDLWVSAILEEYRGLTIADLITKKPDEVNGAKAIFNTVALTNGLQDYAGTVTFETANTTAINLVFDKAKYFAYQVGDLDKVQAAGDLLQPLANKMAYQVKKDIDTSVLAEAVTGVLSANTIGSKSTKKAIATADEAYEYIVDLGTKLDGKDVPEVGRYVIAAPEFVNMLAKDKRVVDNAPVLANGVVQGMEINGMQVIKSNLVPANTVIALHNEAVGYGKQLDEIEAMRLQSAFADGVRGLVSYGVKTLRPEGIAVLHYSIGATTPATPAQG